MTSPNDCRPTPEDVARIMGKVIEKPETPTPDCPPGFVRVRDRRSGARRRRAAGTPASMTGIKKCRNGHPLTALRELEEVAKAMLPPARVRLHPHVPGIAECVVDDVVVSWHKITPDSTPIPHG